MFISGILLAAGESSRMQGQFKPLMKWGGRTIVAECVHQMELSRINDIFVVLGHREAEVRPRLANAAVQFAINKNYKSGMLSSIKTGIEMLSPNTYALLIMLVDQPMISASIINSLITAYETDEDAHGIAYPSYQGKHGHPIIIHSKYIDEILQLNNESPGGLRDFIEAHRSDCLEVSVDDPSIIQDIDTLDDYKKFQVSRQ